MYAYSALYLVLSAVLPVLGAGNSNRALKPQMGNVPTVTVGMETLYSHQS